MNRKRFCIASALGLLFMAGSLSAQEKPFSFEMGVNYPMGLQKNGFEENRLGFFFGGEYRLPQTKLGINLHLSYESYTVFPIGDALAYNGRSIALIPSLSYWFKGVWKIKPYAAIGVGVSVENIGTGVFNEGYACHLAVVPKIGIRVVKHIDLFAQYYVSHRDFSRLIIGCGYVF